LQIEVLDFIAFKEEKVRDEMYRTGLFIPETGEEKVELDGYFR
jgi:hypothetical protein